MKPRAPARAATRGAAMVLVATLAWSFAGVFTRSLSTDVWTTVAWRSMAGGTLLLIPYALRKRGAVFRELVTVGGAGWAAVGLSAVAQAATTAGLFLTSVAHVTVIYATCPFLAAVAARIWLGEAIPRITLAAIALSLAGVALVVAGAGGPSTLAGDAVALAMTASFAALIVLSKAHPDLRMLEVTILSAFLTFLLFLPMASTATLDPTTALIVAAYGFNNMVLAFFLFLRGARHIPAATSGLIATLEIALSPFWVWLFFGEAVDGWTLLGGLAVAAAVTGHLAVSFVLRDASPATEARS